MGMWSTITEALSAARAANYAADNHANIMAELLAGRLRHVDAYKLATLKRELRDFDLRTKSWKK
jgi:hypothetical protein